MPAVSIFPKRGIANGVIFRSSAHSQLFKDTPVNLNRPNIPHPPFLLWDFISDLYGAWWHLGISISCQSSLWIRASRCPRLKKAKLLFRGKKNLQEMFFFRISALLALIFLLISVEEVVSAISRSRQAICAKCRSSEWFEMEDIDRYCPKMLGCGRHLCNEYQSGRKITCSNCPTWPGFQQWTKCSGHHEDCAQCGIVPTVENPPRPRRWRSWTARWV